MKREDRVRIVIAEDGRTHTVAEKLYKEIDDAAKQGIANSYLIHPSWVVRFLAGVKIKLHKGVAE